MDFENDLSKFRRRLKKLARFGGQDRLCYAVRVRDKGRYVYRGSMGLFENGRKTVTITSSDPEMIIGVFNAAIFKQELEKTTNENKGGSHG